ncbi:MAG: DUF541 domain-containing protein [Candidatus Omnitrophica bacterium]|nr:DUF541 domain-containing protein [Candidatus Omnitrophota bacterium]
MKGDTMNIRRYMNMIAAGAFMFFLAAPSGCASGDNTGRLEDVLPTVTVNGRGRIDAEPDNARARFGVISEDKGLAKAYSRNTRKMNEVIKSLRSLGIDKADIKTSSYSVTPVYRRDDKGHRLPGKPATYKVSGKIEVRLRDLDKVGLVIDEVMASGANTLDGIDFTSTRLQELETGAKAAAAADARKKANVLTESLGVRTGRVLRVDDASVYRMPARNTMAFKADAAGPAPRIEPGMLTVEARCRVVYEILE